MNFLKGILPKRSEASQSAPEEIAPEQATSDKPVSVIGKIGAVIKLIGIWLYRLRKIFLAIPVLYGAFRLAFYNMANLPAQVGINLQVNGEYAQLIDRNFAVYGPLGVTAACLLIMFLSRRPLHPWVISIFTLVLPLLILFTNLYPQ